MSNYRSLRIGAALIVAACLAIGLAGPSGAQIGRPFLADRYALFLNGGFADFLQDVQGGAISADVLEVREGTDSCGSTKHVRGPKYEDFDVLAFIPPARPLFDWVSASLTCEPTRSDGRVSDLLPNGAFLWSKDFFRALISEVTVPACDASSKEPGYLGVKFSPEAIQRSALAGPVQFARSHKMWLPSNFRLEIAGLDTSRVVRIEPLTIKRQILEFRQGGSDIVRKLPGNLDFPNVVVTLPLSKAGSWIDWHEDFVVNGNSGPANEKEGVLTLLAPNLKTELMRIMLHRLGIIQVEPSPSGPGNVKLVTAVMYCDSMELVAPGGP